MTWYIICSILSTVTSLSWVVSTWVNLSSLSGIVATQCSYTTMNPFEVRNTQSNTWTVKTVSSSWQVTTLIIDWVTYKYVKWIDKNRYNRKLKKKKLIIDNSF